MTGAADPPSSPPRVVEAVTDALYHRLVGTGDVWRTRAASTAAFLATAGATLVAGILLRGPEALTSATRLAGVIAIVCFILSAAAFTSAAMHSPPKPPGAASEAEFVKKVLKLVEDDRAAIWGWIQAGRAIAGAAMIATAVTLSLSVYDRPDPRAGTILLTESGKSAMAALCPNVGASVAGLISEIRGQVTLNLAAVCPEHPTVHFRRSDVVIIAYHP